MGQGTDEEEAAYRGAETGVEGVLAGGGLEAEGGEEGVGWVVSGRAEGVGRGDVADDCVWEVIRCLNCGERLSKLSSGLTPTLTSRWR